MTNRNEIYKCEICGNIVEILHSAKPPIFCCGTKMVLQTENTTDAATEKHVPVLEKVDGGWKVVLGEVEHPMTAEHYIEWIELIAGNEVFTKYLNPGDKPEAIFMTNAKQVTARAYCNLHGNWKKDS